MSMEKDILSFNYLKLQPFTGSHQGMRYCIRKKGDEKQGDSVVLEALVWPEPFNLEHTDEAFVEQKEFPFSDEGRTQAIEWLEERYSSRFSA